MKVTPQLSSQVTDKDATVSKAYILEDGEVITEEYLNGFTVKSESQKITTESLRFQKDVGEMNIVDYPYPIDALVRMCELSTPQSRCVQTLANDTVGLGWKLVPVEGIEKPNESQKAMVMDFLDNPHPEKSFDEILRIYMIDYWSTGNSCMELLRHGPEEPLEGLENLPIHTVRRHNSGKTVLHRRGVTTRWFKLCGVDGFVNKKNGKIEAEVEESERGNEVIWTRKHTPRSDFYGIPDIIPAVGAVLGERKRQEYNIDFFANHAMPAYAVTVAGGQLDADVKATIKRYFQEELRKNRHSTLVICVEKDKSTLDSTPIQIKFEALSTDVKEASFRLYRQDNFDEILTANGVPAYRAGVVRTGSLGTNVAAETTEIYKHSIIKPVQRPLAKVLTRQILWLGFDAFDWELEFVEIDTTDEAHDVLILEQEQRNAWITPEEARAKRGWPARPDVPALGQFYMQGFPIGQERVILSKRAEYEQAVKQLSEFRTALSLKIWEKEV